MNSPVLTYPGHCQGGREEPGARVLEAERVTLQADLTLNLSIRETSEHLARTSCDGDNQSSAFLACV